MTADCLRGVFYLYCNKTDFRATNGVKGGTRCEGF